MKKVFYILMVCAVLMIFALGAVMAAGVSMWFADSTGADPGQTMDVVTGTTFTLNIYGTADANSSIGLAVGFDKTSGSVGTSAVALDKKITLATGVVDTDITWSADILNMYSDTFAPAKTAGLRVTTQKNWGVYMARDNVGVNTLFNNILIATINLKNNMAAGEQYNIEIVKGAANNSSYCSFINIGQSTFPGASDVLTINSVSSDTDPHVYTGEMIWIPEGSFLMGNNGSEPYSYQDEFPQHSVTLSGYWIGKYEVTRSEYQQFIDAGGYSNSSYWSTDGWSWKVSNNRTEPAFWADSQTWTSGQTFTQTANHPVVGVSYYEAEAFCKWAGGHLPTEAQWEKAARWDSGTNHPNVFPWGDVWDPERCNDYYDSLYPGAQTAPVGSYSSYQSPSGCQDMSGNVREWCQDWYKSYPESSSPFDNTNIYRVLRGGSWYGLDFGGFLEFRDSDSYRSACRSSSSGPDSYYNYVGLRVTKDFPVTSVTLNKITTYLVPGAAETLVSTVNPTDATNKDVTWSSTNTSVANVDSSGVVTAVGVGYCIVKVTTVDGGFYSTCLVTVSESAVAVTGVILNKTILSLNKGASETLAATVTPSNATNKGVTWSSSNISAATVNNSGKVTAVNTGSSTITVTTVDGGFTATCLVTVSTSATLVTGVTLNKTTLSLNNGASETLIATVSPSNATNKGVTWSSSNTFVATADSNGKVTAVGGGNCTITVTTTDGAKTAVCQVTVMSSYPVTNVTLNKVILSLGKGNSETIATVISPSNASNKNVTWVSNKTSVAEVDSNGKVNAVGYGSCTITVTTVDGGFTAICLVDVPVPVILVENITLDKTTINLEINSFEQLTATVNPSDAANKAITWKSSNTSIATVDGNGKVTAKSGGTCLITVTTDDGFKTASCQVIVDFPKLIYFTFPTIASSCDSFYRVISIGGNCDTSITKVKWQIDEKRKGSCKVSNGNWSASKIALVLGENLITVIGATKTNSNYANTLLVRYIDNINPEVKIILPSSKSTYSTTKGVVNISGSAKDLETISKVSWVNIATGISGICTGTKSWKALGVALALGNNEITISAEDSSGNIGTSKIVITRVDKTKPKIIISNPATKSSFYLDAETISLGGTAFDNFEVAKVEWVNKLTGESGVCTGTSDWSVNTILLQIGKNIILITATDTSGNIATDTISVIRKL